MGWTCGSDGGSEVCSPATWKTEKDMKNKMNTEIMQIGLKWLGIMAWC
jgi:hypothetical protein